MSNYTNNFTFANFSSTIMYDQFQEYLDIPLFIPLIIVSWLLLNVNHKYHQSLAAFESFKEQSADEIFSLQKSLSRMIGYEKPVPVMWTFGGKKDKHKLGPLRYGYPDNICKRLEEAWQNHLCDPFLYENKGVRVKMNGNYYRIYFVYMEQRDEDGGNVRAVHRNGAL